MLPSMQQSKIMRSLFEPPKGQKRLSFTKLAYMHVWPMYIKQNPEFFYTFRVRERILCINSNWGMLIYIWGKALKDTWKLHAWSNLHMHMSHHSRIKFKLIFRTTIAICFNSKSIHTHTHTHNTMMHNWTWNWNGSMIK